MRGILLSVVACCALSAQPAGKVLKFEVASIKPTPPGIHQNYCGPPFGSSISGQQLRLAMCTVRDLVMRAWNVRGYELRLPRDQAWISSARFDVTAKSASPVSPIELGQMLGPLLEDRFRLKWHRQKREAPVYFLDAAKGGMKLERTKSGTCTPWPDHRYPPPPPNPHQPPTCDYPLMPGTPDGRGLGIDGTGVTMPSLVNRLTGLLGRNVIDRTGFTASFDLHIRFARETAAGLEANAPAPSGYPSLFTAVHTLGLQLVSGKAPIDVLVVDSAQKPSEN